MNRDDFTANVAAYIRSLWPKYEPTPEQVEIWFHRIKSFSVEECREALAGAYARGKFTAPTLAEVIEELRKLRKDAAGTYQALRPDIDPAHIATCRRDSEDENFVLSQWTKEDREAAKWQILCNEPDLDPAFGKLSAMGETWRHLIISRCVEKAVTIYPDGVSQTISVEDWWAQPHKIGVPIRIPLESVQ